MKKVFALVSLVLSALFSKGQTYQYATFNAGTGSLPGNYFSGNAVFSYPATVPNFNYVITSTNSSILGITYNLGGADELKVSGQPWENKYGVINKSNTPCLKVHRRNNLQGFGGALANESKVITTFEFNTASDFKNWGFMILDIDIDQCEINATAPDGTPYSNAEIASWFKGTFDGNITDGNTSPLNGSTTAPPCFDGGNATLVGSYFVQSVCAKRTTVQWSGDDVGAYAYFEPTKKIKELTFIFNDLQDNFTNTDGPSQRYFFAAAKTINVSGNVFNDADGLNNNLVDGALVGNKAGLLWAYFLDASNTVIDSVAVKADGSYTFPYALYIPSNYNATVMLSDAQIAIGTVNPTASLPAGWSFVGEKLGTTAGGDGLANGKLALNLGNVNVTNVNFGIQRTPTAVNKTFTIPRQSPNAFVTLNGTGASNSPAALEGFDDEDGALGTGKTFIVTVGAGMNGNRLFYNSVQITSSTTITNYNPNLLSVQFSGGGSIGLNFTYSSVDAASIASTATATYTINWLIPLPVEQLQLMTNLSAGKVKVDWTTLKEGNTARFEVERSVDGINYISLARLQAAFYSNGLKRYSFLDDLQNIGQTNLIYYRIKLIDRDGNSMYSNISVVQLDKTQSVSIYPNPFKTDLNIVFFSETNGTVQLRLSTMDGKIAYLRRMSVQAGLNQLAASNLGNLPKGTYVFSIHDATGKATYTEQVVKQ
jgi:Secretion system C-terminal sorting domain